MSRKDPILPRSLQRTLRVFLRDDLLDEVTGDLHEMYKDELQKHSRFIANIIIWYQVLQYLRPFAIRKKSRHNKTNPIPMYKSYFITAIRNMIKNKMHASLNILGLSVGVTVAIIVMLWVTDELSHEKNFANFHRIGRVIQNVTNNGQVETWYNTPWPLSDELRKNYGADFAHIAVSTWPDQRSLQYDTIRLARNGVFAEAGLARMLAPKMIYGTIDAVDDQTSLLISNSTAVALFGKADAIGKQLRMEEIDFTIGGVYQDIPPNSEFTDVHYIGSWALFYEKSGVKNMSDPWRPNAFATYVQLQDHATYEGASARIKDAKMKKISEALQKKKPELFIHPMSEWHLNAQFENGKQTGGRMQYVILFSIVGVFVVFMACINFMNLSTARSEKRAKEVGIRKAIGSLRGQLVSQFLWESLTTVFISVVVAVLLTQATLPFFNMISEKNMSMPWSNIIWWLGGLAFTIIIGLIAGSYPAFYLSSMRLGRSSARANSSSLLRKTLVTIQFTVSVVLMIGTAVVYLQIQHAKNRPLGYNSNGLVTASSSDELHKHLDAFRTELKDQGSIAELTEATSSMTSGYSSSSRFEWNGKDPSLSVDWGTSACSPEYGATIGWNVIKGRDFSRDRVSDSSAMILNRAAAEYVGLDRAVGETMRWADQPYEIIGVVDNMITNSPYGEPGPNIYILSKDPLPIVILRLNPAKPTSESLSQIELLYKKYAGESNFDFEFNDVAYARKFGNEERVGTLATTVACLAIFISCLGIFGLSSFTAELRTKEIGVRKVLGATLYDLWQMMSKDFVLLVLISCIAAVPIAYFVLNGWLENFKYHMSIPVWTFAAATVSTLLITLLTVSWHTLSAAGANPVKSLRAD